MDLIIILGEQIWFTSKQKNKRKTHINEMQSQSQENHCSSGVVCKAEGDSSSNSGIHSFKIRLSSVYSEPVTVTVMTCIHRAYSVAGNRQ